MGALSRIVTSDYYKRPSSFPKLPAIKTARYGVGGGCHERGPAEDGRGVRDRGDLGSRCTELEVSSPETTAIYLKPIMGHDYANGNRIQKLLPPSGRFFWPTSPPQVSAVIRQKYRPRPTFPFEVRLP